MTAAFNLNLLARINREVAPAFDLGRFGHKAIYNARDGRIEMHLVSQCAQDVWILGHCFRFRAGETIHTENSYKYSISQFRNLARSAGWIARRVWTGTGDLFTVRNIGNLVPPCTGRHEGSLHGVSAAIQFAVEQLRVDRIIVMGHGGCGGIRALLAQPADAGDHPPDEGDEADYLGAWVRIAAPARRQVEQTLADASPERRQRACEQAAILVSLRSAGIIP